MLFRSGLSRPIDEHPYLYPLIKAQTYYLWNDYDPYARYARYYDEPYGFYPYPYSFYPYGFDFGYHYRRFPRYYFGMNQYYPW